MMDSFDVQRLSGKVIHMVGIKGTGMTALAEILVHNGAIISGSDVPEHFYTDQILSNLGVQVSPCFSASNIPMETNLVIHSAAYKRDLNPELIEAKIRNLPILLYTEALGAISKCMHSIGISGVHGKTTTTAMAGTIIKELSLPVTVLAGSGVSNFDGKSTLILGSKYFVAETCEYQRHFLSFHPSIIVLTSVESDHQDYYPEYKDIYTAFLEYVNLLPHGGELIFCNDNPGAREVAAEISITRPDIVLIPYGESALGAFQISSFRSAFGETRFKIARFSEETVLHVPGKHLALDATAAIAVALTLIRLEKNAILPEDEAKILQGIASFKGSKRRSEILGEKAGVMYMDDYAHHPTAIMATLRGLKEFHSNRRIIVDFMSHTYSRTKALLSEFAAAFADADILILHKIYASARETIDPSVSGLTLFEAAKSNTRHAVYFEEPSDAIPFLRSELKPGDLFITMGAGDNWKVGQKLFDEENI